MSLLDQTPQQRVATILLRLFGALFVAVGMANTFLALRSSVHQIRDVAIYLFVCVVGVATIFLWRGAAIALSVSSLAIAVLVLWRSSHGVELLWAILIAPFFIGIGLMPGLSTLYLWRSLR